MIHHKKFVLSRTTDDNLSTLRVGLDIYQKEGVRGLWRGVGQNNLEILTSILRMGTIQHHTLIM